MTTSETYTPAQEWVLLERLDRLRLKARRKASTDERAGHPLSTLGFYMNPEEDRNQNVQVSKFSDENHHARLRITAEAFLILRRRLIRDNHSNGAVLVDRR